VILVFIGGEMLLANVYKLSNAASLGVVALVLVVAVAASLLRPPAESESREQE
jgi:predicted tellurium resistance membrane protein TerC